MKLYVKYNGEDIFLKNYNSYLSLDKMLSLFESKEHLMTLLDLDPEVDNLFILDKNDKPLLINNKLSRTTVSFYEQGKGEEFVNWIYDGVTNNKNAKMNAAKLSRYFVIRLHELNDEIQKKPNPEGRRLQKIVRKIKENLEMFRGSPEALKSFEKDIVPPINEYIKRSGTYDYAYMKKFASSLISSFEYEVEEPSIRLRDINEKEQEAVIEGFKTVIYNHFYPRRQVTIDNVVLDEQEPIYDENGIKIDEKEFLEEFKNNKKLYKGI